MKECFFKKKNETFQCRRLLVRELCICGGENDKGSAQSIFMRFTRGSTNSLTSLLRVMHRFLSEYVETIWRSSAARAEAKGKL